MPVNFVDLVNKIIRLINPLIALLAALSLLVFFKGLAAFIAKSGDEKSHTEGRNLMVWGIIALFVMVSFLGIISLAKSDLGFTHGMPLLPTK